MDATRICSVERCDRSARTRGWCQKHYQRWLANGDPLVVKKTARVASIGGPCAVQECDKRASQRGWCHTHYQRWVRTGSVDTVRKLPVRSEVPKSDLRRLDKDRFARKYQVSINGCWLWTSSIASNGYGKFRVGQSTVGAHKWSYEARFGRVPHGMQLDHLCRVRHCVNPDHLEVVTPKVNTYRGISVAAVNAAKTHCIRGHGFTDENTRTYLFKGRLHRACKACRRQRRSSDH